MSKKTTPKKTGGYAVGYKRPPRATQFKPGQSGNPKGRPKGSKNFASHIAAISARKVSVHEKGKERRVSMAEAILLRLMAKALGGDMAATRLAVTLMQVSHDAGQPITETFTSESDRALVLAFIEQNASAIVKRETP